MFKSDSSQSQGSVEVCLDGRKTRLAKGLTVAAALLDAGEVISRISPTSGKPCSPHCLMGVCYECWMEINGVKRQACMTQVEEGMEIIRFQRFQDDEKEVQP